MKVIEEKYHDTESWTALDRCIEEHHYSLASIVHWPLDACVVAMPTNDISLLLGSMRSASDLRGIKQELNVSVNVVISVGDMDVRFDGARPDWSNYFAEQGITYFEYSLPKKPLKVFRQDKLSYSIPLEQCYNSFKWGCLDLVKHFNAILARAIHARAVLLLRWCASGRRGKASSDCMRHGRRVGHMQACKGYRNGLGLPGLLCGRGPSEHLLAEKTWSNNLVSRTHALRSRARRRDWA
eukprot:s1316_g3.t1